MKIWNCVETSSEIEMQETRGLGVWRVHVWLLGNQTLGSHGERVGVFNTYKGSQRGLKGYTGLPAGGS